MARLKKSSGAVWEDDHGKGEQLQEEKRDPGEASAGPRWSFRGGLRPLLRRTWGLAEPPYTAQSMLVLEEDHFHLSLYTPSRPTAVASLEAQLRPPHTCEADTWEGEKKMPAVHEKP
jgi:hypothetical protein